MLIRRVDKGRAHENPSFIFYDHSVINVVQDAFTLIDIRYNYVKVT